MTQQATAVVTPPQEKNRQTVRRLFAVRSGHFHVNQRHNRQCSCAAHFAGHLCYRVHTAHRRHSQPRAESAHQNPAFVLLYCRPRYYDASCRCAVLLLEAYRQAQRGNSRGRFGAPCTV